MTKTLIDASKGEFEFIDMVDGKHRRNDGELFEPADKNPWYVLATVFGEQAVNADPWHFEQSIEKRNRRAWNGWACSNLNTESKQKIADIWKLNVNELYPLAASETKEILRRFRKRLGDDEALLPNPMDAVDMSGVVFLNPVGLEKRYFASSVDATLSHFLSGAYFRDSVFSSDAIFRYSYHRLNARFNSCKFLSISNFTFCNFKLDAHFSNSSFEMDSYFTYCSFFEHADFNSCRFSSQVFFTKNNFASVADFSGVDMNGRTMFDDAVFETHVPVFHAANLYRDTVFPTSEPAGDHWPPVRTNGQEEVGDVVYMPATEQKRAHNTLRYFMNQNLEIDQELFFHRREMACKEVTEDKWINRTLIKAYGWVSDYGSSIPKPLIWLGTNFAFGFVWLASWLAGAVGDRSIWAFAVVVREACGWSFSNVFAFFRFGNLFYGKDYYVLLPVELQVLGATQTILGFIFLFLLGLGIRSRFRLR